MHANLGNKQAPYCLMPQLIPMLMGMGMRMAGQMGNHLQMGWAALAPPAGASVGEDRLQNRDSPWFVLSMVQYG